ncbi:MAG: cytochrome B [Desulfobacteraceae bacterium]|nr:cytochrome B [Desulfobacteraceae bacterium]
MEVSTQKKDQDFHIKVWDLPTRLFHWLLAGLVITSFVTASLGGNLMILHMRAGYAVLALLIFRLIWGTLGGYHSRFTSFVRGPREVFRYAGALTDKDSPRHLGHNPMGGWSVVAMLGVILLQALTGLFANDDIFIEGPLYPWVSKAVSDQLTRIHHLNAWTIATVVVVHVGAILFYLIIRRENLVGPMISGFKTWHEPGPSVNAKTWVALLIAGLAGTGVYLLVR